MNRIQYLIKQISALKVVQDNMNNLRKSYEKELAELKNDK